jgi:hypothetical protein
MVQIMTTTAEFEVNNIIQALKTLGDNVNIPDSFSKAVINGLSDLTAQQEGKYKNTVGYAKNHKEETANTLEPNMTKMKDDLARLEENAATAAQTFQRTAGTEISRRYAQIDNPSLSSSSRQ